MRILLLFLSLIFITNTALAEVTVKGDIYLKKSGVKVKQTKPWKEIATKKLIAEPNSISKIEKQQKKDKAK